MNTKCRTVWYSLGSSWIVTVNGDVLWGRDTLCRSVTKRDKWLHFLDVAKPSFWWCKLGGERRLLLTRRGM